MDPTCCKHDPVRTADGLLRGGAAVLQLRWKDGGDREQLALGRALAQKCRAADVPFVMNDRADLARLAEATGLHLGQDDLPVADARRVFSGPVGLSTHDLDQVRAARGADLIGFGPVFATASKENPDPVVGLEGLRAACAESSCPVVAIGGLTAERAPLAVEAGATLVAAISALCGADDPEAAARAFAEAFA